MVQGYNEAIGSVTEVQGSGQIIHADGSTEPLIMGAEIYQGDRIETLDGGSANLTFTDESSFAVSSNSSLVIDEYVFDGGTEAGVQNFNMMKGMFVYTSGLIGRDDPDDVHINTPVGSIGIRGTIIAGDVDSGQITVVEGAIVLKDFNGQEVTLANQYETARFGSEGDGITHIGQINGADLIENFKGLSAVSAGLFSNIQDSINDGAEHNIPQQPQPQVMDIQSDAAISADESAENNLEDLEDVDLAVEDANAIPVSAAVEQIILDNPFMAGQTQDLQYFLEHGGEVVKWSNGKVAGYNHPAQMTGMRGDEQQEELFYNPYGRAPIYVGNDLPQNYWKATNGMTFTHNFSHEFIDPDARLMGQDELKFSLVSISNSSIVRSTGNLNAYGEIDFDFSDFESDQSVTFTIKAEDKSGNDAFHTYTFNVVVNDGVNDITLTSSNQTVTESHHGIFGGSSVDNLTISDNAHHNVAFMGGGNDVVTIHGDHNTVYGGAGNNTTTFGVNAEGNVSYGADGRDTFTFDNLSNQAYGFGNNDTFKVDMDLLNSLENVNNSFFRIKGEGNSGDLLLPNITGDTLKLTGLLSSGDILDFTKINNNYIRGIETIDINNGTSDHIKLNLSDVFNMTNANDHILKINANTGDTVDIVGMTQDEGSGLDGYHQFSGMFNGENVTLYIQDSATVPALVA